MLVHIVAQEELRPGDGPVGLILVPTRNLCTQVANEINKYSRGITGFKCLSIFGNVGCAELDQQSDELQRRCDVMVATPGRLNNLLHDGKTNLKRCTYIVLDEADELLAQARGSSNSDSTGASSSRDHHQVITEL